jgi:CHAD domain-containing protein
MSTIETSSADRTSSNSSTADVSQPAASQLLWNAFKNAWETYLHELERCRKEFSEEAIHDLRVATRRLMAVVQLLRVIEPRPALKRINRELKRQLDAFDELRDTQVILTELSTRAKRLPDLQGFQNHQQVTEDRLLQTLGEEIYHLEITELSQRVKKTLAQLEKQTDEPLEPEILQAVDDAYLRTRQRLDQVDLTHPATIHHVRVAFKRFRYMVEIVHPLLKDFPPTNLKWMNDYQTLMGDVQDAEVFIQRLGDYFTRGSVSDPGFLRRYYERRKAKAISRFAEHRNQLNLFWRPAPDEPFPWERVE